MRAAQFGFLLPWFLARMIALPAFLMPYRIRILYIQFLSACIHAPFRLLGYTSRRLLELLHIEATTSSAAAPAPTLLDQQMHTQTTAPVAVLYSGGTDSTCAAALAARDSAEVHLLTFVEYATRHSPIPQHNIELLKKHFPTVTFVHSVVSVDTLVRYFSYEHYAATILRHGMLALATPGFSSLSWHVRAIQYCHERGIKKVSDGLTRELMHFPGHMDAVIVLFKSLYARYGIEYETPLRSWPTPPDRQFLDRLLVDRHEGYALGDRDMAVGKTTGRYLYELGIFPSPNIKGTRQDFGMQHDCYPFALYNIIAFWGFLSHEPYEHYCARILALMRVKVTSAEALLDRAGVHTP